MPSLKATFLAATVLGAVAVLTAAGLDQRRAQRIEIRELVTGVWISEQVLPTDLDALRSRGIRALIDLRPDGEQEGQPSSAEIEAAARTEGVTFAYIPVAHGRIAPAQVDALARSLGIVERPVLLYCRSGKRAARTWALSEASRFGGLDAQGIHDALRRANQPSDDLDREIAERIAARAAATP